MIQVYILTPVTSEQVIKVRRNFYERCPVCASEAGYDETIESQYIFGECKFCGFKVRLPNVAHYAPCSVIE